MYCWLDITSPSEMYLRVKWPDGVPYPAPGDDVLFRQHEITWGFTVTARTIGVGFDPKTMQPAANVLLTVDTSAPSGWRPEHHC